MKKIFLCLSGILFFVSCDKVSHPIISKTTVAGSKFINKSNDTVSPVSRKMLLEDYTGQKCINCPRAANTVKNPLLIDYPKTLVVLSIHQGQFASPSKGFPNNFQTDIGDNWGSNANFGISSWPTGIVNRKNYNASGLKLSDTKWTSVINVAKDDAPIIKLDLLTQYDTTVRALNLYVKGTFVAKQPNAVKLIAVYIEDGLTGPQEDANLGTLEDFEFEHVLRGGINGFDGVDLTTVAAAANDVARWSTVGFQLPEYTTDKKSDGQKINDKNVSVVIFAYDKATGEVLQAEKVKIR